VVRDWYLSAYEPILDPERNIIGIIYVGVLEKKFADYQQSLLYRFLLTAGIGVLVAFALSSMLLSGFVRPINRLASASAQVAEGQFPSKIREEKFYKETYDLTRAFNLMVEYIRERDETLRKLNADLTHINEELMNQNKNYMELLGFVVHELKSPINSITLGLSTMMSQSMGSLNDKQKRAAEIIMKNAAYLNTMIRNYLDLSRIEKGELSVSCSKALLEEEIIEPIKFQLVSQLEAAHMTIIDDVPRGIEIESDVDLMKVAMNNLLGNAAKYGHPGSAIKIFFQDLGHAIQVGVWNEGQAIPAANTEKLFAKFTDMVAKDRMGRRGTGLGLFITKEIVEKHGGTIWAESEEGKWIQFTFRIPKTQKIKEDA
jgi:two-component system, NtrC family, sensor kinase